MKKHKELAMYNWIQCIRLGKSNSLNNKDFLTDYINFSWCRYSFVTIVQTLTYVNKSVMYFLYANNVSITSTVTITPESINYKNSDSVFINFLKNFGFFYKWIQRWNDGYLAIKDRALKWKKLHVFQKTTVKALTMPVSSWLGRRRRLVKNRIPVVSGSHL